MNQYTKQQVVGAEKAILELINDHRRGGYIYIHGYLSEDTGEISNHWVQASCLYPSLVARSIKAIEDGTLLARVQAKGLNVHRNRWTDGKGIDTNRKANGLFFQNVDRTYTLPQDENIIKAAMEDLKEGLVSPKKVDQGYTAVANGTYQREGEQEGVLYIRDCLTVAKVVTKEGEHKPKASLEINAVKEALRRLLPVGRYRAYKLHENFEYIIVDGAALVQGVDGDGLALCLALPDEVKNPVAAAIANAVASEALGQTE